MKLIWEFNFLSFLVCANGVFKSLCKLKHRSFLPNIKKHFFTMRVTKHRHRVPRAVVESPSLEIFKSCLDGSWALGLPA